MKRFLILSLLSISAFTAKSTFIMEIIQEETELMRASEKADLAEMQILIDAGEDVNAAAFRDQPRGGKPVLRYAIDSGSIEAVRLLLKAGATPDNFTSDHREIPVRNLSLLLYAIAKQADILIIKELLLHGAALDGSPRLWSDWDALMVASYKGYTEAAKLLLDMDAPITMNTRDHNKTALDYAREKNHREIVNMLETHLS